MQDIESPPSTEQKLIPSERVRIAWALTWPCITASLIYEVAKKVSGLSEYKLQSVVDLATSILFFFLFSTWVIRRTVNNRAFPGFHLNVFRQPDATSTPVMQYKESVSVTWLLVWRTTVVQGLIMGLIALAFGPLSRLLDTRDPIGWFWVWTSVAEVLIFYFWLVEAMLKKRYAQFSLSLVRGVS
jgi:hypothetical protein